MNQLARKKVLLGITGSIAAYKTPYLVRALLDKGCDVRVVLTESAQAFVTKLTLQTLSGHSLHGEMFNPAEEAAMSHIALARWADVILIAPASANFIAKLACGFANDLLNTLCLAATVPILIAPAMNQQMWLNSATQENVEKLKSRGYRFLGPAEGIQACGEDGPGRMLEPDEIIEKLPIFQDKLLKNKKILITAGPTHEPIDPVRYIANRSSGKMGYALTGAALGAGAIVTLISGPVSLNPPVGIKLIRVNTAKEMQEAVQAEIVSQDIYISVAAVSDYKVNHPEQQKIKRQTHSLSLVLEPTVDILEAINKINPNLFIVGFAAETEDILGNAKKKLLKKNADLIVANDVSQPGIGFGSDDNAVTVISRENVITIEKSSKQAIAQRIIEIIYHENQEKNKLMSQEMNDERRVKIQE